MSETAPVPSQRGHMPPTTLNSLTTFVAPAPLSTLIAPPPLTEGTLNENACGEPMCGVASLLNRMRSRALASG